MTMRLPDGYLPSQAYNKGWNDDVGLVIGSYKEYMMAREWRIFQKELDMYGCVRSEFEYI